jgi:hypothetical protein
MLVIWKLTYWQLLLGCVHKAHGHHLDISGLHCWSQSRQGTHSCFKHMPSVWDTLLYQKKLLQNKWHNVSGFLLQTADIQLQMNMAVPSRSASVWTIHKTEGE